MFVSIPHSFLQMQCKNHAGKVWRLNTSVLMLEREKREPVKLSVATGVQ